MEKEKRIFRPSILIMDGPYAGWKACGPYEKTFKGRRLGEFYYIARKGTKRKYIEADVMNKLPVTQTHDEKPFLDFIK